MSGFFDVHCHMLPGVDDGAKDEEQFLKMLSVAHKDGIRNIIFTPHFHPKRGNKSAGEIIEVFKRSKKIATNKFPDMHFFFGQELYYRHDLCELLKQKKVLTLAGKRYVLVEFSTDVSLKHMFSAFSDLQMNGFIPVVAHVERYEEAVKNYKELFEIAGMGVFFQLNASSVLGYSGGKIKKFCKKMFENDAVSFIGTDAHDTKHRPPILADCAAYIEKKFGTDVLETVMYENPYRLIKGTL